MVLLILLLLLLLLTIKKLIDLFAAEQVDRYETIPSERNKEECTKCSNSSRNTTLISTTTTTTTTNNQTKPVSASLALSIITNQKNNTVESSIFFSVPKEEHVSADMAGSGGLDVVEDERDMPKRAGSPT